MIRAARRAASYDAWEVPRDLALRRYPPFVTGGALPRGHVPVFVSTASSPSPFGRKLEHLARNDYVTLSEAEYLAHLRGAREPPERAVVLTFDDGRSSVWTVVAAHAAARNEGDRVRRPGTSRLAARIARRPGTTWRPERSGDGCSHANGADPLLSWEELELPDTDLFDFDSHTYSTRRSTPRRSWRVS